MGQKGWLPPNSDPRREQAGSSAAGIPPPPIWFAPCVFESFGRIGEQSRLLIARLAAKAAIEKGVDAGAEIFRWMQLLSLRLAKDSADMLING